MLALLLETFAAAELATASVRSAATNPTLHHDLNFIPPSVERDGTVWPSVAEKLLDATPRSKP
jgi:hypothetical protein